MIMYSNKNYLEDRNNQNQASTTIYNIQEVDHTFGARLCSNGEFDYLLRCRILLQEKSESPTPLSLPRYDPFQISFLKEDGGISKRKNQLETQEETRKRN